MSRKVFIPEAEIEFTYARSSGPGGQNVNKVNSKAVLRWSVSVSFSLTEEERTRIFEKLAHKITSDGDLIVMCDTHRDQKKNKQECLDRLHAMIAQSLFVPKKRKKTKVSRSVKLKNKESKKRHSEKKKQRRFYD